MLACWLCFEPAAVIEADCPWRGYCPDHTFVGRAGADILGLAFDEHTAIEIRGDMFRLHEFSTGGQVHRGHYCEATGHYTFDPVEVSSGFAPLSSLGIVCT